MGRPFMQVQPLRCNSQSACDNYPALRGACMMHIHTKHGTCQACRKISIPADSPRHWCSQFVDEEQHAKFVCVSCSRDVASDKAVVWEGYMSARRPSRLFRNTVNVDQCPAERQVSRSYGVKKRMTSAPP
jgi:hypothetical protein